MLEDEYSYTYEYDYTEEFIYYDFGTEEVNEE
jgi:hypothetical protein